MAMDNKTNEVKFVAANHELDLEFVNEMGGVHNNAPSLHDEEFMSIKKADECYDITSKIFLNSFRGDYKIEG